MVDENKKNMGSIPPGRTSGGKIGSSENQAANAEAIMLQMRKQAAQVGQGTQKPDAGTTKFMAEYTLVPGDTLSAVALKFYIAIPANLAVSFCFTLPVCGRVAHIN